nr:nucleotidyltransferase domain-containing protein [Methanobrevibacter olleyae]
MKKILDLNYKDNPNLRECIKSYVVYMESTDLLKNLADFDVWEKEVFLNKLYCFSNFIS